VVKISKTASVEFVTYKRRQRCTVIIIYRYRYFQRVFDEELIIFVHHTMVETQRE